MTIAVRQISPAASYEAATNVTAFSEAALGGSCIVQLDALGNVSSSTATVTVSDTSNGAYTNAKQGINGSSTFGQYPMVSGNFFPNCAAGSYNITSNAGNNDNSGESVAVELTGMVASSALDAAPAANVLDAQSFASNPSGTLAQAVEIAFSLVTVEAGGGAIVFGEPTGFTNIVVTNSSATYSGTQFSIDYSILSSTASITPSYGSLAGSNIFGVVIVFTLKGLVSSAGKLLLISAG
jgi:hypothetical protein